MNIEYLLSSQLFRAEDFSWEKAVQRIPKKIRIVNPVFFLIFCFLFSRIDACLFAKGTAGFADSLDGNFSVSKVAKSALTKKMEARIDRKINCPKFENCM